MHLNFTQILNRNFTFNLSEHCMSNHPYLIELDRYLDLASKRAKEFQENHPFPHVVIDDFLDIHHAEFLSDNFPETDHEVWLDWRKRSPHQFGKQGPGNSEKFSLLAPELQFALYEFNSWKFLQFLEKLTGIEKLLPDPYYTGGGMAQILKGGILDIHTDFNDYSRLGIFRRINVIIYLTRQWEESYGGSLELWDGDINSGKCVKSVGPVFNRAVIFRTDKKSFHGHPKEWNGPDGITRRSIALYYYTADKAKGETYNEATEFQGVASKEVPGGAKTRRPLERLGKFLHK
jgi:Rps23 Pro-64 3,4-dihydroxylase Tpa1-like proline 4-hydroxylase